MLFNEQEMMTLCNEMGIDLINNDKCTIFPTVESGLFNLTLVGDDKITNKDKSL